MQSSFELMKTARCGACHGPIDRFNLVELSRAATWKYPTAGNVVTGEEGRAVGVLCDRCVSDRKAPEEAIEFRDGAIVYHPIHELDRTPQLCAK